MHVVNTGAGLLADAVEAQAVDVTRVDWRPPMPGTEADLATVAGRPAAPRGERAGAGRDARRDRPPGRRAARLGGARPAGAASSCTPARRSSGSGPPGPLRGALLGGAALEGLVDDPEDAVALFEAGTSVSLEPCHHRGTVGPMAGVVTPSMWVWVLEDRATGRRTHCTLNEGLGKVLRYGAYSPDVLDPAALDERRARPAAADGGARGRPGRRHRDPGPDAADGRRGAQPQPGRHPDAAARPRTGDGHQWRATPPTWPRRSGSSAATTTSSSTSRCRPASSRSTPPAGSTGPRWWWRWRATAPTSASRSRAPATSGSPDRPSSPTASTSATTDPTTPTPTSATPRSPRPPGIGGFAMATAPAIVRFVGGSVPDALATTRRMHEITLGENPRWAVPVLEFQGTPTGIDVTQVCRTGILPQINTGMAGKVAGVGQVGAGLVHPAGRDLPEGTRRDWRNGMTRPAVRPGRARPDPSAGRPARRDDARRHGRPGDQGRVARRRRHPVVGAAVRRRAGRARVDVLHVGQPQQGVDRPRPQVRRRQGRAGPAGRRAPTC